MSTGSIGYISQRSRFPHSSFPSGNKPAQCKVDQARVSAMFLRKVQKELKTRGIKSRLMGASMNKILSASTPRLNLMGTPVVCRVWILCPDDQKYNDYLVYFLTQKYTNPTHYGYALNSEAWEKIWLGRLTKDQMESEDSGHKTAFRVEEIVQYLNDIRKFGRQEKP